MLAPAPEPAGHRSRAAAAVRFLLRNGSCRTALCPGLRGDTIDDRARPSISHGPGEHAGRHRPAVHPGRARPPTSVHAQGAVRRTRSSSCGTTGRSCTPWPSATSGPSTSRPPSGIALGRAQPGGHAGHLRDRLLPGEVQFPTQGVPYALYAFVGILCWSFFAGTLGTGGNSLLANKALLAKTQFPRECFPLETMLTHRAQHGHLVDPAGHPVRDLRPGAADRHRVGARCSCSSRCCSPPG